MFHQLFVKLLQVSGCQLGELDLADSRDGVGFDDEAVSISCGRPDIGLGVKFIPTPQPSGYCVVFAAANIQTRCLLLSLG